MALNTIALTVLAQSYAHNFVRAANKTAVAVSVLPWVVGGGKNVAWPIKGTGKTAVAMDEGEDAGTATVNDQFSAVLNWSFYKSVGAATGPAQAAASSSSSPDGNMELLANDINDSLIELASAVNLHTYSGDPTASPAQLTGLDYAIASDTNVYATINRTSEAAARPTIFNPGTPTAFTAGIARADVTRIKTACGEAPDLAMMHPDIFTALVNSFDSSRSYVQSLDVPGRGTITLDASVQAVRVGGCIFIEDKDCTLESGGESGRVYYLNSRKVSYEALPSKELRTVLPDGLGAGMTMQANDGFGDVPLMATIKAIAASGDADTFMAKTYLQLKVASPKHCGVRRYAQLAG